MEQIWNVVSGIITADNIALFSVIITVFIFIISRSAELMYKKHDDKKVQYLKLISLLEKTLVGFKRDKKGETIITEEIRKQFFDAGSSLLLYGSKRLYKQYLFFREFSSNSLIQKCKHYKEDLVIYIMSDILITMRKEVGLNRFNNIHSNEALGFFVNDITSNPIAKRNAMEAKFRIKMIKFELSMIDRTQFIFMKNIYYKIVKPPFAAVYLAVKYLLILPFGKLIIKLFPKFSQKVQQEATQTK